MTVSTHSRASSVVAKRAEAAANPAAKEAEYKVLLEEEKLKETIQLLEEQQRTELEAQTRELERIHAEKDLRAARARLQAYKQEAARESLTQPLVCDTTGHNYTSTHATPSPLNVMAPAYTPLHSDVALLAQAVQDSLVVNRLPAPEPSVFDGNPLHFIEWKALFKSLIDQHKISTADKLFYLKIYVGGAARKL